MTRKLSLSMVLIIVILLVTACAERYERIDDAIRPVIQQNVNKDVIPELGIHSIIEDDAFQTISVHYPVTGNEKVDKIIEGFALNRIELFRQESVSQRFSNDDSWPFELHLEYKIVYETSRHLSLVFTESKYLGGPQSNHTVYTYNFNLEQGRQLALKDLFKGSSAYLEILSQYVYDQFINQNILNIALDENWVVDGSEPIESNFRHFLMTEKGIIILFEKYQLGPAFIGEPTLEIPYEVFAAHIELKELILVSNVAPITTEGLTETVTEQTTEIFTEVTEEKSSVPSENVESSTEFSFETTTDKTIDSAVEPKRNGKKIAITFEDGPHPLYTPLILDTLESRGVVSTFFLLGNRVAEYPELTRRIYNEGHLIGNHTWSHPQLTRLSNEDLLKQLDKTNSLIYNLTGFTPTLYRPPFGIYNENVITLANKPAILWSIDPLDLKYKDSEYITNFVLDHAFDGGIILLRDTNPYTTQALTSIIDGLESEGYEIVSVNELLQLNAENASQNIRIFSRGNEKN